MAKLNDRITSGILGLRDAAPVTKKPAESAHEDQDQDLKNNESMEGGSRHDRDQHSGSRDVTEGTTVGTETGGTRNYRSGGGAIGTDIGNRPE